MHVEQHTRKPLGFATPQGSNLALAKTRSKGSQLNLGDGDKHARSSSLLSLATEPAADQTMHAGACRAPEWWSPAPNSRTLDADVFALKISPDNQYIACALGNGHVQLYHAPSGTLQGSLALEGNNEQLPCTAVAWKPQVPSGVPGSASALRPSSAAASSSASIKHILLATYASGQVVQWHVGTRQQVWSTAAEKDVAVNCVAYEPSGAHFATGGTDCTVRVFSDATKKLVCRLVHGTRNDSLGHSNRIFSVCWHPTDPNTLISGGWDNTVQVWDLKAQVSLRSIFGPHLGGDALAFSPSGETIVSASYAKDRPLQLWRTASGEPLEPIPWSIRHDAKPCFLYTAQVVTNTRARGAAPAPSADAEFVHDYCVAGGGGPDANELKIFDLSTRRCVAMVRNLDAAVYSAALSRDLKTVAVGTGAGELLIFRFDRTVEPDFLY